MKILIAFCMSLGLATATLAKPAPLEWRPPGMTIGIDPGRAAATMEANYFRAPASPPAVGKIFPCRLRLFDKARLARTCD
jgi:hypothetical protein